MRIKPKNFLAVISLCVLGTLVYSNTFHSPFHFDDAENITGNANIRNLGDLKTIWNYWPPRFITYLSVAINYHFNQLRVPGYHLVNLLVHLSSAILVRWFILLTFSTPAIRTISTIGRIISELIVVNFHLLMALSFHLNLLHYITTT